ncbi:FAD-binding oxidoreductase [Amycolatopsis benzoatilytica]|uniref:FAD-binding oxidoreductase n=1 Tax=Amycolatopsis benzoatilytica TaxID=346045 RepID=UPI001FE151BD|nr:FAD-dependent oxidoreductase [Amycolatopsis benzoatilytica]
MTDLSALDVLAPGDPAYEAGLPAVRCARPRLVVRCHSVSDVRTAMAYAAATGERVVPRGGGHCFAGRSSTDGIVLDLSPLDRISVAGGTATVGAGARLGPLYTALHHVGQTIPAGCGDTVGVAGVTLGGGIGMLGRRYGLTCDRLVGAQAVLADRSVVACDQEREPDLFWALRGAGGGQFGIVTEFRFATVAEPSAYRIHGSCAGTERLVAAWQDWAPDAPDWLTLNLTLDSGSATLFGAAVAPPGTPEAVAALLRDFAALAGLPHAISFSPSTPYSTVKSSFAGLDADDEPRRIRSEFFSRPMSGCTVRTLLQRLSGDRRLAFTAMGGAYNRVAEEATAFAHRSTRYLLEHIAEPGDPWVDESWAVAHAEGTGRVYPNFPDLALRDPAAAYHAANHRRLAEIKRTYDPGRVFDFPQAV